MSIVFRAFLQIVVALFYVACCLGTVPPPDHAVAAITLFVFGGICVAFVVTERPR